MKQIVILVSILLLACSPQPAQEENTQMGAQSILNWPGVLFSPNNGQTQTELPEIEPNVFYLDLPSGKIPDNSELILITQDYFAVIQIVKSRPLSVKITFVEPANSITYFINKNNLLITNKSGNILTVRFR